MSNNTENGTKNIQKFKLTVELSHKGPNDRKVQEEGGEEEGSVDKNRTRRVHAHSLKERT